jgi:hypothetical protein
MIRSGHLLLAPIFAAAIALQAASAAEVRVGNRDELARALDQATPGTTILVAPGNYRGGLSLAKLRGTMDQPIVIAGVDPARPPVIEGGGSGLHLSSPEYLELRNLVFDGASGNGLNIDDAGSTDAPAHHVVLRSIVVRNVGPQGNRDGIKLSGVNDFRLEDCRVERWGSGGSAVDMVGCHGGVVKGCRFLKAGGDSANGVQAKGGSSEIVIQHCRFENAGGRAVNAGGSTGLPYFRPRDANFEAKNITVEDCEFIGGSAAVAFVGVDGALVQHNTVYRPRPWAIRILQETTDPRFVACCNGRFVNNVVVFRSDEVREIVNIGVKTAPETFEFKGNVWHCLDRPADTRRLVRLPAAEAEGSYGKDPQLKDPEKGDVSIPGGKPQDAGVRPAGRPPEARHGQFPLVPPRRVPLLPLPEGGRTVRVSDAQELAAAVANARDGDLILLSDGTYRAGRFLELDNVKNVSIRGASSDPAKVVLQGRGFEVVNRGDDILRIAGCENVTVAYLTFADCHAYGLKVEAEHSPKNIHVYHCHFLNCGTRGLKGSTAQRTVAAGGSVRFCHFENTKVPPGQWQFGGNYISAIDMMALEDWTFSDNAFVNIKGHSGGGRAAIFLWVRSRRLVVERNRILNCDRGIAFGNPSGSSNYMEGMLHVYDSICRNNCIVAGPDAGIELAWVDGVKVYNNTVWRQDPKGRGIRSIEKIHNVHIANNLVRGALLLTGVETARNNLVGPLEGLFVDPAAGDLRLAASATAAIGKGLAVAEVRDDFGGVPRGPSTDIGAVQYVAP